MTRLVVELKEQQSIARRLKKLERDLEKVTASGGENKIVLQDTEKEKEAKEVKSAKLPASKMKSLGSQTTVRNTIIARRKNHVYQLKHVLYYVLDQERKEALLVKWSSKFYTKCSNTSVCRLYKLSVRTLQYVSCISEVFDQCVRDPSEVSRPTSSRPPPGTWPVLPGYSSLPLYGCLTSWPDSLTGSQTVCYRLHTANTPPSLHSGPGVYPERAF